MLFIFFILCTVEVFCCLIVSLYNFKIPIFFSFLRFYLCYSMYQKGLSFFVFCECLLCHLQIKIRFHKDGHFTAKGSDEVGDFHFENGKVDGRC